MAKNGIPTWKRTLDCVCIGVSAPMWLPVMILLTVWIKLVSKGPVFFVQERIGYKGSRFKIYKLRSMHCGASTQVHEKHCADIFRSDKPMEKLDAIDPRLIRLGRIIRATGLDELPQIFNVLKGEMSLVGPRPCTINEYESYSEEQRERFDAPPGVTGNWQVNGKNNTTFARMIQLDIEYARNMSFWFDIRIMFRTPIAIYRQVRGKKKAAAAQPVLVVEPISKFLRPHDRTRSTH